MDMMTMVAARRSVQRRTALRALGAGVAAVAVAEVAAEAKGKKGRKAKDRCPAQVSTCEAAFADFCGEPSIQAECLAAARECCAPLKSCDATSAMECFIFRFLVA